METYGRPPSLQELTSAALRSASPTDRAYHQLKRGILTCQLIAGSRLDERALARKFGVTHSPVREACRRLLMEGLVIAAPGNGHGVAPITLSEIRDLCELRKIVESKTAALAAQRVRPEQAARLLMLAELPYEPGKRETYDRYLRANSAFHSQLARTAGNPRLEAVVIAVLDHLQRPLYLGLDLGLDPNEATREHMEVVDAVRRKRPSLAARLMEQQLERGEKRMLAVLASSKLAAQVAGKTARAAAASRRK
jgi:DNA-binding GntR family transcriptional regulator